MSIEVDPQRRVFLLTGEGFGYAVWCPPRLTVHDNEVPDLLVHLHWGPPVTLADAVALASTVRLPVPGYGSGVDGAEEYPPAGGLRFGLAAVDADVAWRYAGYSADGDELSLEFAAGDLSLGLGYRVRGPVLERWASLTNAGDAPVAASRLDSAVWTLPRWPGYRLSHLVGQWAGETRLRRVALADGVTEIGSRRGISSHHANPWFAADDGTATDRHGEVYAGALAWSGSWRIAAQRVGGRAQVFGGWLPGAVPAGQTLTAPAMAGVYTPDGFGGASRALHAYQRAHVIPRAEQTRPVLYNSWEATGFTVDEAGQLALAKRAAGLGVELFVMDDGWFGEGPSARTGDRAGLGDWWPNPARFPTGLRPLIDGVHALDMGFGLWVEPEMVNPDSGLYRAHPDWAHHRPDRPRYEIRHQLVLDLGRPVVAEWTHGWLDRLLSTHDIQFIKWDMNRPLVDVAPEAAVAHVRAAYAILDRLRADHPGVAFECCAGGGGRGDLGMIARTDQLWTSDNTDAADRLRIQYGFSQAYPARVMCCWATDAPRAPLRFRFHVAMAGVLGIGGDLSRWTDAECAQAAEMVERYKQIRHLVQHGHLYRLGAPGDDVYGVQYVAPDRGEAVVLAYRETRRYFDPPPPLPLRGLDPAGTYRADDGARRSGAALQHHGLALDLDGDYTSALAHLVRAS